MTVFQVCNDPEFIRFICQALYEIQQDCGIFTETDLRKHMFLLYYNNYLIIVLIDLVIMTRIEGILISALLLIMSVIIPSKHCNFTK